MSKLSKYTTALDAHNIKSFTYEINQHIHAREYTHTLSLISVRYACLFQLYVVCLQVLCSQLQENLDDTCHTLQQAADLDCDRKIDWLIDWLIDWFIDWLIDFWHFYSAEPLAEGALQ